MENESHKENKSWLSESLLLAWVPAAGYFLTFCYQRAYLAPFGVPDSLINIGPAEFIALIFSLSTSWFCLVIFLTTLYEEKRVPHSLSKAKWSYGVLFLFALLLVTISGDGVLSRAALVYAILILVFFLFDKTISKLNPDSDGKLQGLYIFMIGEHKNASLEKSLTRQIYRLIGITFIGYLVCSALGLHQITTEKFFSVYKNDPSLILLELKDNRAICGQYDPASKVLSKQFVIVPLPDKDSSAFERKEIGPLVLGK
jgi:hypothetical protein